MSGRVASRRGAVALVLVALVGSAAFVACDLSPQPLPPGGGEGERSGVPAPNPEAPGSGFGSQSASDAPSSDAGVSTPDDGGAHDAGDAGTHDAGDAG